MILGSAAIGQNLIDLSLLSTYESGTFDEGAMEILSGNGKQHIPDRPIGQLHPRQTEARPVAIIVECRRWHRAIAWLGALYSGGWHTST